MKTVQPIRIEITGLPSSGKAHIALKIRDMIKGDKSLNEKIIDLIHEEGYAERFENGSFSTILDMEQAK